MLRLVLWSGRAAPLSHWHRPGKIRTHPIQASVNCFVPCCNGSPQIHGLLVGPHKAVGQDTFPVCQELPTAAEEFGFLAKSHRRG